MIAVGNGMDVGRSIGWTIGRSVGRNCGGLLEWITEGCSHRQNHGLTASGG